MKYIPRVRGILVGAFLISLLGASVAWAQTYSHVRIVRLSFVEGTVTIQRPDVSEWASASVNTPLEKGFKLSTAEKSFAEVEFENGSTVRLGEGSLLEFTELALAPSGDKVNRLTLQQGYATFSLIPHGNDVYEVKTTDATLTPYGKTTFRADLDEGLVRVEVFRGSVEVASSYGSQTVAKDAVLDLRPGAEQPVEISQGISKDEWDEWVDQRESAETVLRNKGSPGFYTADVNSLQYGWNDLWNYGNWSYFPGYGYGWIPNVPSGWVPYGFGRWCWYPGWGYTWISAEPWGWLPFHYGGWNYFSGIGWYWLPGNFATWSPAQVVWYQGPGWVGWAPRSAGPGVGQSACQNMQSCSTAVSVSNFQNGQPVTPRQRLAFDLSQGQPVTNPDIPPTRLALLPGSPHPQAAAVSRITFDPASGRFVNSDSSAAVSTGQPPRTSLPARNLSLPSAAPLQSGAAPVAAKQRGPGGDPTRLSVVSRPAPTAAPKVTAPPRVVEHHREAGSSSSANSPAPGPSAAHPGGPFGGGSTAPVRSAPAQSHESMGGSRGGGGFEGWGGGTPGGAARGVGGGGGASEGHASGRTRR